MSTESQLPVDNMPEPATTIATAVAKNIDDKFLAMFYKDALQPGVKQVGKALENVLGLGNTALLPVKMVNEKFKAMYDSHMDKYRKNLEQVDPELIVGVLPELGIPIMERLEKTSNEKLSELYINLLTNASIEEKAASIHPKFIQTVESLTPDEVKIIEHINNGTSKLVPYIDITIQDIENSKNTDEVIQSRTVAKGVTYFEKSEYLYFPSNSRLYFINLESLGILQSTDERIALGDPYKTLEDQNKEFIKRIREKVSELRNGVTQEVVIDTGIFELTEYGRRFIDACKYNNLDESKSPNSGTKL
jgi:hypothetical protein